MLGVDASTLRAWEVRYDLVVPDRSTGGQRLYSRDELAHLRFVIDSIAAGVSPGDAHRMLAERLQTSDRLTRPPRPSRNTVVLLAERDRYGAELAEYLLRAEGYDVCLALDAEEAVRFLAERQPSLSVVELMISGGGLKLCAELAASGDAPVLAVSALELADEAMAAGASGFMVKPIDPGQLISAVRELLGASAMTRPPAARATP